MVWPSAYARFRRADPAPPSAAGPFATLTLLPAVLRRLTAAGLVAFGAEVAFAYLWPTPRQAQFDASLFISGRGEPLRVAAVGDSTLTAPGLQRADDIWIRIVARRLADETGRAVDLRSYAVGGSTSEDVLRDQLPAALDLDPHLVFVSVGANDLIRGLSVRRLAANLDSIVESLRGQGAEVILSGVGDLGTIPRLAPPLRHLASRLGWRGDRVHADVATRHGAIKADQWRSAAPFFRTRRDVWSIDRFHPNAAGHEIWAATAWEVVEPLCIRFSAV